jgi:hypothetical protein
MSPMVAGGIGARKSGEGRPDQRHFDGQALTVPQNAKAHRVTGIEIVQARLKSWHAGDRLLK